VYFSDDSCVALRCNDGIFRANVDISSCDSTHTDAIFEFVRGVLPEGEFRNWFDRALGQLKLPVKLKSSSGSLSHKMMPQGYQLFSGSTLTTLTNNIACLLFSEVIHRYDWSRVSKSVAGDLLQKLVKDCGYNITIDVCDRVEDIQFLKHSPDRDGKPWMNFGPILRGLGVAKSGVIPVCGPRTKDPVLRAARFEGSKILGLKFAGETSLKHLLAAKYDAVKLRVCNPTHCSYVSEQLYANSHSLFHIDDGTIMNRYGAHFDEYHEFLTFLRSAQYGDLIRCRFVDKVMEKDYSMDAKEMGDSCGVPLLTV